MGCHTATHAWNLGPTGARGWIYSNKMETSEARQIFIAGHGMMNAPGLPLSVSLIPARKAGVNDPALSTAIERSEHLIRFHIGKGVLV